MLGHSGYDERIQTMYGRWDKIEEECRLEEAPRAQVSNHVVGGEVSSFHHFPLYFRNEKEPLIPAVLREMSCVFPT